MYLWMIVQILIESLPISSSGHVMLLEKIYQAFGFVWPYHDMESIQFLFHISAFFIMLHYFFNQWSDMIFGKKFELLDVIKISSYQKIIKPLIFVLIADVITFLFWKSKIADIFYIQKYFLPIGFSITAIMLYATKNIHNRWILQLNLKSMYPSIQNRFAISLRANVNEKNIIKEAVPAEYFAKQNVSKHESDFNFSFSNAVILGTIQGIAFLPGISRFASTFFAARILGYKLKQSFAISFLIQFPLVCAAIVYGCLQIQDSSIIFFENFNLLMLFAMVGMSFVSYKIFSFMGTMIEQNKIWYFSLYMIIPIILAILV